MSLSVIYIITLNNTGIEQLKIRPLKFLRAFAKAWTSEDIDELEQIIVGLEQLSNIVNRYS